ncbi:hypothetical protein KIN20_007207 [Parelaphostrongylus tenuis]|uniref:Uncharacterized protein n=1 Tax=Parelaphostrongylus tenuis TaxID=148309 RepID=A0AAD5ML71_PARTN|nr:hypothetical protein KIN20_007207 [Parelaphostrongylus tenuis]
MGEENSIGNTEARCLLIVKSYVRSVLLVSLVEDCSEKKLYQSKVRLKLVVVVVAVGQHLDQDLVATLMRAVRDQEANAQRNKPQGCVNQDAQNCEELTQIRLNRKKANLNDTLIPSFPENLMTSVQQTLMHCGMPNQQVSATSTSSHRYSYC